MMRPAFLLALSVLAGCAAPHAYLGVQAVAPLRRATPVEDAGSAYVNVLFPLGERWSFQIEPIIPFTHPGEPAMRVAFDYELWKRK